MPAVTCPRCQRPLRSAGPVGVFQCDACVIDVDFLGVKTQANLTVVVDSEGNVVESNWREDTPKE